MEEDEEQNGGQPRKKSKERYADGPNSAQIRRLHRRVSCEQTLWRWGQSGAKPSPCAVRVTGKLAGKCRFDSAEHLAPGHVLRGEIVGQQIGSSAKTGNNRDFCPSAWTEASGRSLIDHDSIKMPPTPRDRKPISWMTSATQRSLSGRPSLESAPHAPSVSALTIWHSSRSQLTGDAFIRVNPSISGSVANSRRDGRSPIGCPTHTSSSLEFEVFSENSDGLLERTGTDAESAFDDASFTADVSCEVEDCGLALA